jgi:hypothetical protein
MQWITEKPTQSGYYWIYTVPEWEDSPIVTLVDVVIVNNKIVLYKIPCSGVECDPERTTHYMRVNEPEPPKG